MLAVSYGWVWHRCVRPLPKTALLLAAATILFVVFPLAGEVRTMRGADRTSLEFLRQAYLSIDNPIVTQVSEMGGSIITLAYTLELVPSTRPFDYGMGYLYALSSIFPSLFWDVHPMVARELPSDWLIWAVDPIMARMGGGLGFSFIAEAYLNFGPLGVPVVMAAMGYLYCQFVRWGDNPAEPAKIAALASFTAFTLAFARGEASMIARPLIWCAVIPYLAFRLFHHYSMYLMAGARIRRPRSLHTAPRG